MTKGTLPLFTRSTSPKQTEEDRLAEIYELRKAQKLRKILGDPRHRVQVSTE